MSGRRVHPDWCAGGHRCNLGEHRSDPMTVDLPGAGRLLLVRVRGRDGREHAEVHGSIVLPVDEGAARLRLARLLRDFGRLLRTRQQTP